MIIAYVGTPGSGKSYDAVNKILDNLKTGRVVFTNIDGMASDNAREYIKNYCSLTDDQLFNQLHVLQHPQILRFWLFADRFPGALVVVDEVHKLFSNRNWASDTNKEFCEWASTHRHSGHDVILITQDIEKIDKHARSLVEWTYFYKKINQFGSAITNRYRRHAYDCDDHFGKPIASHTFSYNKQVFNCYQSYTDDSIKELGAQKNINAFNHPIFYAIPVVFIAFVYFFSQSSLASGDLFGSKKIIERSEQMKKEAVVARVPDKIEVKEEKKEPAVDSVEPLPAIFVSDVAGEVLRPIRIIVTNDGRVYADNTGYYQIDEEYVMKEVSL